MIKYENIEIKYGDFVAIDNLNLDIREGEFFTFLGPSGCGKTTSLRALVGFLTPSKGKVYVGDKDVTNLPIEKRNIGMVFQSYALFPTMTVYDNIAFGMKVKKLTREEIDRKVHEVAAKIKITEEQLRKTWLICPVVSSRGWRWPELLYWSPKSFVWMSRCPTWMQS